MGAIAFNADEMFTMAEQIERNGAKFYRKAAENNANAKELLLKLASMEDKHLEIFSQMHKEVSGKAAEPTASDPDKEGVQFAKVVADGYVFDTKKDPSETLKGNESLANVLKTAIGLEKDSIIFYLGMKDMVSRSAGKDKLDTIIKEEMSHIAWINKELGVAG